MRYASVCAIALWIFLSGGAKAAGHAGQVVAQRGVVTAIRDGSPRALHIGAEVAAADRIRTGADAKVEIALRDGSTLVVGPASEVALARFEQQDGGPVAAVIELFSGILRAGTGAAPVGLFEVRGRTAIASVRGTRFVVEGSDGNTAVLAIEGSVRVAPLAAGDAVLLGPGEGTDVPAGGAAAPPKRWGEARVRRVLALTSLP